MAPKEKILIDGVASSKIIAVDADMPAPPVIFEARTEVEATAKEEAIAEGERREPERAGGAPPRPFFRSKVLIGCRLPSGLLLQLPRDRKIQVKIDGVASSKIIGSSFAVTLVDADFWAEWKAAYAKSPLLTSQVIFEARSEAEATSKAKELQKEKTGFEQMPQQALGVEKAEV
jgi:hypothetical protein